MTHAALQDLVKKWRATASSLERDHSDDERAVGIADAMTQCADELSAALSAMEGEVAGWIRVDPVKTEPAIFVTDEAERALWASLGYTLRPIAYTDTAPPPQQAVGEGEKCPDCGDSVEPNPDAEGKTRCADCWGKNLAATNPTPSPGPQEVTLCEKHGATWVRGCDACNDDLEALSATEPYATPPQPETQVTELIAKYEVRAANWNRQSAFKSDSWAAGHAKQAEDIVADLRAIEAALTARTEAKPEFVEIDRLAQFIRQVNGDNKMGAGVLAEHILEFLCLAPPAAEEGFVVEVRRNEDGSLDEIVGAGRFHLEQMHDGCWSLGLGPHMVTLTAKGKIKASVELNAFAARPQPAQGDGWLPIESAPRDGTPFLACRLATGGWEKSWTWPATVVWASYHPNASGKECWRTSPVCGNKAEAVTHWRPLPPPPAPADGGGK